LEVSDIISPCLTLRIVLIDFWYKLIIPVRNIRALNVYKLLGSGEYIGIVTGDTELFVLTY
jgi:hypothetical protein